MRKQELQNLIDRLDYYNRWRRGEEDLEQPDPKQLGKDLDEVIAILGGMLSKLF